MRIGCRVTYTKNANSLRYVESLEAKFQEFIDMGIKTCQLNVWEQALMTDESAEYILECCKKTGMEITGLWAGWSGPCEWNFNVGPAVIGLVPAAYRAHRTQELINASAFAEKLGVTDIITHCGFIPENPNDPDFMGVVGALRKICNVMKDRGQYFLFETGQETPITLVRTIEAVGTDNLGINLDTGNLILYGKANPVDALDVFGQYVRNTHIKDGYYPTTGNDLGHEARMGDGKANFPALIKKLNELGYTGPLTIERENHGEQQKLDIIYAKEMLERILDEQGISKD